MRFGIELPFLDVGNPKWPARLTGGPMIETVDENKYSFNMQVSVKAMAAFDRVRPFPKSDSGATAFAKPVQSIRYCPAGATLRKPAGENHPKGRQTPELTNPLCVWISLVCANQHHAPHGR
jgi:hypothetical protein